MSTIGKSCNSRAIALGALNALVLPLLPLALIISFKGYPLYFISMSSFTLARLL